MERSLKSLACCALAAFAVAAFGGCSPKAAGGDGGCNVTCPTGCDISADCLTCTPESETAGAGTACQTDSDCCTGSCVNNFCSGGGGGTSSGGATGGTSGGTVDAGTNLPVGSACTGNTNCSSGYCKASVCTCNGAHPSAPYSCVVASDCCTGTTCTGTGTAKTCVAPTSSCMAWTGTPNPTYDMACNGNDGGMGSVCGATGTCIPNCTVTAGYCTAGQTCEANGHCAAAGTSGGTSSGGVGGTSGGGTSGGKGTSGGGTSGGATSGGAGGTTGLATACTATIDAAEFTPCDGGVNGCPTGLTCYNDVNNGGLSCEYACTTTPGCPDQATICQGGSCVANLCGPNGGTSSVTYDAPCNAAGTNDGTCFPLDAPPNGDGGTAFIGICLQGGSIANGTAACSPSVTCAANDLCAAGWLCNGASATAVVGNCIELCNVTTKTGCATGSTCVPQTGSTDLGVCQPNTSGGTSGGGTSGGSTGGGTSGGSTGGLPGDTCAICDSAPCAGATDDCVFDPSDLSLGGDVFCAMDCASSPSVCTGGTTCTTAVDVSGSVQDSVCYPASMTCVGSGGMCSSVGVACQLATDCCSNYCRRGTCHCNGGGDLYPCSTDADCCAATSTGCGTDGFCQ